MYIIRYFGARKNWYEAMSGRQFDAACENRVSERSGHRAAVSGVLYADRSADCCLPAGESSTEHLLHHVARHAVEEQGNEDDQQEEDDDFEEQPAVVVPEDVANRLEWVQEPDERRVRATASQQQTRTRINNNQLLALLLHLQTTATCYENNDASRTSKVKNTIILHGFLFLFSIS